MSQEERTASTSGHLQREEWYGCESSRAAHSPSRPQFEAAKLRAIADPVRLAKENRADRGDRHGGKYQQQDISRLRYG
jgi:hypothetical protein